MSLKLVIFDVDGTLVDSQGNILAAMGDAFSQLGLPCPDRTAILSIVGLSLPEALLRLAPEVTERNRAQLVEAYKAAFAARRAAGERVPLYPGIPEVLESLAQREDMLLAVATGKSRRGLNALIDANGWHSLFVSRQVADDHPSKPNPSMILAALSETGCSPQRSVMIGDTTYDMQMAQSAGIASIGVGWGYHSAKDLQGLASLTCPIAQRLPEIIDLALEGTP